MGPLEGLKVVEFAGIGPGPFACMMLADMGATVLRIDRPAAPGAAGISPEKARKEFILRGRKSITLDLKNPEAVELALKLIERSDALVEGFRPGVMERLGLGPEACFKRNPKLVYGRMTGWGQSGPLASAAGHDINYISLSGALWSMGEADRDPVPPLNLLGDFGGGGMFLAFGVVCALLRAKATGEGDVVDAAICDGTVALMASLLTAKAGGRWKNARQSNRLDGSAPFYGVYKCSDGQWVTIAPLEEKFWELFLQILELSADALGDRSDVRLWPEIRAKLERIFAGKTRAEWCELFEGTDICFAPVLDLDEAPLHDHNRARNIFIEAEGAVQPAPAPRFQKAAVRLPSPPPVPGEHNATVLREWGLSSENVEELAEAGVI